MKATFLLYNLINIATALEIGIYGCTDLIMKRRGVTALGCDTDKIYHAGLCYPKEAEKIGFGSYIGKPVVELPCQKGRIKYNSLCYEIECLDKPVEAPKPADAPANAAAPPAPAAAPKPVAKLQKAKSASAMEAAGPACWAEYKQCGGRDFFGPYCCEAGLACKWQNDFYAQCLKA